ncbi:uncharacterized protein VTP21DRAFT_2301 [Calcarisporiella thermophila]|uniref:uncharacterized protein n=1 Tax=Calcarisporiella thermophila TaxID=911321 RepID=UPI003742C84E
MDLLIKTMITSTSRVNERRRYIIPTQRALAASRLPRISTTAMNSGLHPPRRSTPVSSPPLPSEAPLQKKPECSELPTPTWLRNPPRPRNPCPVPHPPVKREGRARIAWLTSRAWQPYVSTPNRRGDDVECLCMRLREERGGLSSSFVHLGHP